MKQKKFDDDVKIPALTDDDFKRARRVTPEEHKKFHQAVKNFRLRGRPKKTFGRYKPVTIRLNPYVLEWAKDQAKKKGIGYQTFINQTLLSHTG